MTYGQGDVGVAADPFGRGPHRPSLVVSNHTRPFQGEAYLGAGVTTTDRGDAVPLADEFDAGGLQRVSYVSPWTVLTVGDDHVAKRVAVASERVLADTASLRARYVESEQSLP